MHAVFIVYAWQKLHHEKMNILNSMYDNVTQYPYLLMQLAGFVYAAKHFLQWWFGKPKTMHTYINYATILIYVLLLFTIIMPNLLCLSVDQNVQRQCANELSAAYPSTTALQASIKPDVIVLMITGFLVLVFQYLLSEKLEIYLESLFSVLSECLKSIFVHMCFVAIVLGTHGNLDSVTTCSFVLVWFVVESVQVYFNGCKENLPNKLKLTLCNMLLPKNFCPVSHTPFLDAPAVSKDYLGNLGFTLQDQESEMTLNCYQILPGPCTHKHVYHVFVEVIIDVLILGAFFRHQVLGRQTQADADAQLDQQLKKLTSAAQPNTSTDTKKKIMAEVVAEQNQDSDSHFGKNLRTCYYAVLVFYRLRNWFSPWLDWCWQWVFEWVLGWYAELAL